MPDDSTHELRVRSGRASDAAALSEVAREAKALWGYDPAWLEAWRPQLTVTAADIDRMIVRLVESNESIVAFGAVARVGDEWELAHLWVRRAHTRRGIGRILLAALMQAASQAGARTLRIESDPQAETFYLSAGAVRTGAVPAPMPGAPGRELPVLELALRG